VVRRFEDLAVWRKARAIVREVYRVSDTGSFAKDFELRGQIRRAAVSVVSNIAEGYERDGNREFVQHLSQAKGSCGEVRAQLHVAVDQKYLEPTDYRVLCEQCVEISKMLSGLINYLKKSPARGRKFPDPPTPR
jgi:four helix bundle protein